MRKFTAKDQQTLKQIITARRDIRGNRFNKKEISKEIVNELLNSANNAPSVGFSQPWEFVVIKDDDKRNGRNFSSTCLGGIRYNLGA